MREKPNVPFRPAAFPFFYGWVIVGAGTIGFLMSAPGQTIGVSVFTDHLIQALSVSRSQLSFSYMIGTATSAAIMTWAGRVYDRRGARTVAVVSAVGLALMLVYLSFVADLAAFASGADSLVRTAVALVLVTIGFFGIRFFGQGLLTLSSRNMVMNWFERRRGLANAVLGIAISFGFSIAPRVMESLIEGAGWQGAWRILAIIVGGAFALVALLFYRHAPESCGLEPDGGAPKKHAGGSNGLFSHLRRAVARIPAARQDSPPADHTLSQARRTVVFWIFTGTLTLASLTSTAFTFHVVSIFEAAGMDRSTAINIFLPVSIIAMSMQFVASSLSDYFKLKYFLLIHLAGQFAMLLFLTLLPIGVPVAGLIVAHAVNSAMFGIVANITWARYFGRAHLGAISGFVMAFQVGGSAVGPYAFSLSRDITGGYGAAAIVCMAMAAALFLLALRSEQPAAVAEAE